MKMHFISIDCSYIVNLGLLLDLKLDHFCDNVGDLDIIYGSVYRGFAGRPLELKWLLFYRFSWDFLAFSAILRVNSADVLLQKPSSLFLFNC